jgi:hypothetical protein
MKAQSFTNQYQGKTTIWRGVILSILMSFDLLSIKATYRYRTKYRGSYGNVALLFAFNFTCLSRIFYCLIITLSSTRVSDPDQHQPLIRSSELWTQIKF